MYTDEELEHFRIAGNVTAQAREYGKSLIKVGTRVVDVVEAVDAFIREHDCDLSFPSQISINNIAAHFGSAHEDALTFQEGDLVKLDLGAMHKGAVGDSAVSVDLSSDGKHEELIMATRDALAAALATIKPGVPVSEIGKAIETAITKRGFKPVRNLSGHGIGIYALHGKPSIPNYDSGSTVVLEEGMTFACEPFATNGAGTVVEKGDAEIFSLEGKKNVRSPITRNVLQEILKYKGMPFMKRWLVAKFGEARTNYALKDLYNNDMLHMYPPLVDAGDGLVSQAEHSVLVTKDGCEILTK